MDSSVSITLPAAPAPVARPRLPLLAAAVPVVAGFVLWAVTGSLMALCFAALGPLMMLASFFDGGRGRRVERRRTLREQERAWALAEEALAQRQADERRRLWQRQPGIERCLGEPPLHESRLGPETAVVLGAGEIEVPHRTSGQGERAEEFQRCAARLPGAPVAVPLGAGIALRGPLAVAAVRALVVQLCARFGPDQLSLCGPGLAGSGLAGMPHAQMRSGAFRLAVGTAVHGADAVIGLVDEAGTPAGASTLIDARDPARARVRGPAGEVAVALEGLSRAQAEVLAQSWPDPDAGILALPGALGFAELEQPETGAGLPVVIGRGEASGARIDLVADGPHAIVTGMTGSGKSELLVTWVLALAQSHGPDRVAFVLADFKGGTAFDPLRALPQVTAVITDLDEAGSRRGVESLRAELRRREGVLAAVGARDILDEAVRMPRLVIVVDEFAALLAEHPELADVFTDIAARGRALGMHLILGTQRATGVVREALAANCPLRLSLRVTDAADSRALLGTDAAATLPGDASGRGLALLCRPQDGHAWPVRIARSHSVDIERIAESWADAAPAAPPWLPPLPERLELTALAAPEPGMLLLGLADEPARQRQEPVSLRPGAERGLVVAGGPGSGKSGVVAVLAVQDRSAVVVGPDPEQAWDAVTGLAAQPHPGLMLCDDLDALLTRYPADYAQEFAEHVERAIRQGTTAVVTAGRMSGAVARLGELIGRRALLAYPSRTEHLAAGGEPQSFLAGRPRGRGRLDGREVQFALPPPDARDIEVPVNPEWVPGPLSALVASTPGRLAEALRARYPGHRVLLAAEATADPTSFDAGLIVVGDAEGWQRGWTLWQRLREHGDLLVLAECQAELRTLAGVRELPPYAHPHAGRAWLLRPGEPPRRVRGLKAVP